MKNNDVVIVGAGIVGLSIAWQLARRADLRIVVLDKGADIGEGSTGASSAVCRFRYTLDEMVELARDGIAAYQNWQEFTGLANPRAEFHNDGVLWMPGQDESWADVEHSRMQALGVATEVLDGAALEERFPALSACTLAPDFETGEPHDCTSGGRNLYESAGGYVDPMAAAQDLADVCRASGVDLRFKSAVTDIETRAGSVRNVTLGSGERIDTPMVINAAGPWCRSLYEAVGQDLSWDLAPIRVQILYRDRPEALRGHIPVTADIQAGIYFRTQNRGQQVVVGSVLEEDEKEEVANPDEFQTVPDENFQLLKMHALHHRLPALPYRGSIRGHCGLYTMNRDDVHPIVGPTSIDGFWVANGFSGHGFKLAPAIGSMIAQAITGEIRDFDTHVPMSFLAFDRVPMRLESNSVLA